MAVSSEHAEAFAKEVPPEKVKRGHWLRTILQICGGIFALAAVAGVLFFVSHMQTMRAMQEVDFRFERNFRLKPFDLIDATFYCMARTEAKYGDRLALSYIDNHSTRVDNDTGIYKIFMMAHVGTLDNFEETAVHCHVDPNRKMLTQYRTINIEDASVMARALKFFQ